MQPPFGLKLPVAFHGHELCSTGVGGAFPLTIRLGFGRACAKGGMLHSFLLAPPWQGSAGLTNDVDDLENTAALGCARAVSNVPKFHEGFGVFWLRTCLTEGDCIQRVQSSWGEITS